MLVYSDLSISTEYRIHRWSLNTKYCTLIDTEMLAPEQAHFQDVFDKTNSANKNRLPSDSMQEKIWWHLHHDRA